jgi:hypothetical protein
MVTYPTMLPHMASTLARTGECDGDTDAGVARIANKASYPPADSRQAHRHRARLKINTMGCGSQYGLCMCTLPPGTPQHMTPGSCIVSSAFAFCRGGSMGTPAALPMSLMPERKQVRRGVGTNTTDSVKDHDERADGCVRGSEHTIPWQQKICVPAVAVQCSHAVARRVMQKVRSTGSTRTHHTICRYLRKASAAAAARWQTSWENDAHWDAGAEAHSATPASYSFKLSVDCSSRMRAMVASTTSLHSHRARHSSQAASPPAARHASSCAPPTDNVKRSHDTRAHRVHGTP